MSEMAVVPPAVKPVAGCRSFFQASGALRTLSRMRCAATLLLTLVLASTAHATEITNESELRGAEQYREWIARAEGTVPLPKRIQIIEGTPCGPGGCAFPRRNPPAVALGYTPYLWEPGYESQAAEYDRSRLIERTIFTHELGHIWDLERGAKRNWRWRYRRVYRRTFDLSGRWAKRNRLVEGWADAYAFCVTGATVYGYRTTKAQRRRICRNLRYLSGA